MPVPCNLLMDLIKMKDRLYIIGAGSVGGHIASNQELYGLEKREILFLDDNSQKIGGVFVGCPVVNTVDFLLQINEPTQVVIGIAFPKIKEFIATKLMTNPNLQFPSLIAQNAWLSRGVKVGKGCIVYPGCSINYGSTLKDFVVMNMNCALGHHAFVDSYSSLAPGVNFGGYTHIGKCVDMGIGSSTLQSVSIGDYSIVGGQAMVTKSFPENSKIVGVPGRLIS